MNNLEHAGMSFEDGKIYYYGGAFECGKDMTDIFMERVNNDVFLILNGLNLAPYFFCYKYDWRSEEFSQGRIHVSLWYKEELEDVDKILNLLDAALMFLATKLDLNMNVKFIGYMKKPYKKYNYCISFELMLKEI